MHSLSTETIAIPTQATAGPAAQCASCSAPLHADQRYCLECGERRASINGFAASTVPATGAAIQIQTPAAPARPPGVAPPPEHHHESANTPAVIASVGVLLLAMGVGVLIGRSGNPTQAAPSTPQVVTLSAPAGSQQPSETNTTTPSARHAPKAAKHSGGSSAKHPAPASVLDGLKGAKGKSYVEKSKNLPDVVSTG